MVSPVHYTKFLRFGKGGSLVQSNSRSMVVYLPGRQWIHAAEYYTSLASTNDQARVRAASRCDSGTAIWALNQTQGRGRRGRSWLAHTGSLACSLLWRSDDPLPQPLTLIVGIAAAEALRMYCPDTVLKWPNDLWIGDRKLGGILGETFRADDRGWTVMGVGINVNGTFSPKGQNQAISLQEAMGTPFVRREILWTIFGRVEQVFTAYRQGRRSLNQDMEVLGNFLNRVVWVDDGSRRFAAEARAVAPCGGLLLETSAGTEMVRSGDVSLRPWNSAPLST